MNDDVDEDKQRRTEEFNVTLSNVLKKSRKRCPPHLWVWREDYDDHDDEMNDLIVPFVL